MVLVYSAEQMSYPTPEVAAVQPVSVKGIVSVDWLKCATEI